MQQRVPPVEVGALSHYSWAGRREIR
jgi:hypothetical protein